MKNSNKFLKTALVSSALVGSFSAFAADYTTEITSASSEATGNSTAVITAVIAIAVIGFGVGSLLGWFKKG